MNRIKQRIALMTPFLKRRAGAGLIVCTLLLTLLTGSVLAGEVPASTLKPAPVFSISENDWLTASSDYMPQASYDLLMSMQSPGWEELSTEEYAKQITPQLPRLKEIMNGRPPENRFMRYLQYSMAEAGNSIGKNYKVSWNTGFWWDNLPGSVMFSCELNWKYFENVKLTCAQRNQLLDEALLCADRAVRALNTEEIQKAFSSTDARKEFGARLNENAKDLGGNALSIWFSNVDITARVTQDSQVKKERRELLSPLTPEGYRDQTVQDYQALLKKYQDRTNIREAIESYDNKIIAEAFWELNGTPTYMNGCGVDLSLMPAWTMRGRISYMYRLDWKTVDPGHITVGERHDAIYKLITHIGDAAADAVWEAKDWEAFDKVLKERLPKMAQEESTSALTFTVSEVRLDLDPLATEEYMHSSPQSVLNAFMSACYYKNTAQMAAVCVPVGTDAKYADKLAAREKKLNYYVEMHPGYWELGEARNESGKDDVVIIKLSFYKFYPDETSMHGLESRQAQVKQIDGKWYLVPESL